MAIKKKKKQWNSITTEIDRNFYAYRKNFCPLSGKNIKIKTIALVKKPVGIMVIARNVLLFTGLIKNTFQTVCAQL